MHSTGGPRVYAIGDIHGCLADLDEMLARIDADLTAHPHPDARIICVGDYVDRGPDSRGVIDRLIALQNGPRRVTCLKGNHDALFAAFLNDPDVQATDRYHWLSDPIGGAATLASYGVPDAHPRAVAAAHRAALAAVPTAHRTFLDTLALTEQVGDYLFVHAGIRPGIPLSDQVEHDLIWIRGEFLENQRDHGVVVVFGHTFLPQITRTSNWIGIDTGCVFEGVLSCVVLEGQKVWDLLPDRRAEVTVEPHPQRPKPRKTLRQMFSG